MSLQHIEQPVTIRAREGRTSLGADFPRLANRTVVRFLSRYGILIAFLAIWQVSSSAGWVNAAVLPPIDTIVTALWNGLAGGTLLGDIAISLQRAGTRLRGGGGGCHPARSVHGPGARRRNRA